MQDRGHLDTERSLAGAERLDAMDAEAICRLLNAADATVPRAIQAVIPQIAAFAGIVAERLRRGGRLFYVGAGTSGRLGVLDASECPPTFRADPEQVQGIIAGGYGALTRAAEGAEDRAEDAVLALAERGVGADDVVLGIAAGGTTPFVHAALAEARRRGAATGFLACVPAEQAPAEADICIRPLTGPEVVTGSTRLKAGTATKLVLNMITTTAFVRLGKTYGSRMIDLRATNAKLWDRGTRLVMDLCGLPRDVAMGLLQRADGWVKAAVVMHHRRCGLAEAKALLEAAGGHLRGVID